MQYEVQHEAEVPFVMEMLAAAADDGRWDRRGPFLGRLCPVSPRQHEREMLDACLLLAAQRVPMCVYALGLSGATAPASLAGAVAQTDAES